MTENLFNELLDCKVPIRIQPVGLSMHPFIRREDYITIAPLLPDNPDEAENMIAIGDCIILQENCDRWLIHRVIGKNHKNKTIITKGDALLYPDQPVTSLTIWGKVTVIHRSDSEREYLLDRPLQRIICRWIAFLSRCEKIISLIFRLRRRKVEYSQGMEFTARILKFPKWTLTRVFFP